MPKLKVEEEYQREVHHAHTRSIQSDLEVFQIYCKQLHRCPNMPSSFGLCFFSFCFLLSSLAKSANVNTSHTESKFQYIAHRTACCSETCLESWLCLRATVSFQCNASYFLVYNDNVIMKMMKLRIESVPPVSRSPDNTLRP